MSLSTSKGENWFQQAQGFIGGLSATFMSTIPHLLVWSKSFADQMLNSFFLLSVALDLIKIAWESLALAWAHNINLGKSLGLGFNLLKCGVVCLMLFGGAVLTFAASFALMGLMLGLDPVVNFLKTTYFAIRMFCEDDMGKKEFFYEQTIESAMHCIISGIIGSAFVAIIFLPEVIGTAAITAISVVGGGLLSVLGLKLVITGISKAAHQINKWLWPEEKEKVHITIYELPANERIENNLKDVPTDQLQNEEEKTSWDYYQYAVPGKTSDVQSDILKHQNSLQYQMANSSFFNKRREDKINALHVLNNVASQWDNVIQNGGQLNLSKHKVLTEKETVNGLFSIPHIKKSADFSNEEDFEKQTNRILKLTKNHILEKYPSAFQSWKYKGKVESLFEQTFFSLKEKAKHLPQPPAAAVDDPSVTLIR